MKTKDGEEAKEKQERKPREPQMVTANGEKVTHGHAYQSKTNPEEWYFTAKDGRAAAEIRSGWMPPTSPPTRRRS